MVDPTEAECKAFQKKDDGIVSARNLFLISIGLGLKIRDAAKSDKL